MWFALCQLIVYTGGEYCNVYPYFIMKVLIAFGLLFVCVSSYALPDFSVVCIERTPKCHRFQVRYDGYRPYLLPGTEDDQRWPDPGQSVTYIAHSYNNGSTDGTCAYRWLTNGVVAQTGTVFMAGGAFVSNTFTMTWPTGGETLDGAVDITFELNYDSAVSEETDVNNQIDITTRDLTITFFMAQEYFDALSTKQNTWGTYSAVDWLRAQFEDMHNKFEESVHDATPEGIVERVRIDKLIVVPNNQMQQTLNNDPYINRNDGRWQIWGNDPTGYANTFGHRIDYGLIHELGHQLGLIDIYTYDIDGQNVLVTEDGSPLLYNHTATQQGMMRTHGDHPFSEFSAVGLNSQQGRRRGYYGDYQFAIPRTNILQVFDNRSNVLAGATVRCFRRVGPYVEDVNLLWEGVTDASGMFELPNAGGGYSTADGWTLYPHPFDFLSVVGGNQFLVQIESPAGSEDEDVSFAYHWFECIEANISYWKGNTSVAVHPVHTRLQANPDDAPPPARLETRIQGTTAHVTVIPPAHATGIQGYRFYTAHQDAFDHPFTLFTEQASASSAIPRTDTRRYVTATIVYTNGGDVVESAPARLAYFPFMPTFDAGQDRYLAGITLLPNGQRLVCNRSHGIPLWQLPDGTFIGMFSSIHNHLYPMDATYDATLSRVIATDMPDGYNNEYRIRVVDAQGKNVNIGGPNPFGTTGSGDGEFNVPAGVAVDSSSRILVADRNNNRVQAFTSSGTFITKYTGLSRPSGIEVDGSGRILVADTNNGRVQILTWDGATLVDGGTITHTGFSSPTDIAIGDDGEIFVTDGGAHAVFAFDASGNYQTNYMAVNDGSGGTLNRPQGIACAPGNLLIVSDSGNRRVVQIHTREDVTILSFLINNGALETDTTEVTLTLIATSRATEMRFAASEEALASAPWEALRSSRTWEIPAVKDVPHTLYAQVRDNQGTESAPIAATIVYVDNVTPRRFISVTGNDAHGGMSWDTAKATLSSAMNDAPPGTFFYVGEGTFSGVGNFSLNMQGHDGSTFIGAGPARTHITHNEAQSFAYNLDRVTEPVTFRNMRISSLSGALTMDSALFHFGSTGHDAHLVLSNMWLTGPYDGDLLSGVNGTDGRRNSAALYFSRWGGGAYYHGNISVIHTLIERWGSAIVFNDISSHQNALTTRFSYSTIVNCASTGPGAAVDNSVFWLRGMGEGRVFFFDNCVMSHSARDAGCVAGIRFISTVTGPVYMEENLVHLASLPANNVYRENLSYFPGYETDITNVEPAYHTLHGRPYALLLEDESSLDKGWYAIVPEPAVAMWGMGTLLAYAWRAIAR